MPQKMRPAARWAVERLDRRCGIPLRFVLSQPGVPLNLEFYVVDELPARIELAGVAHSPKAGFCHHSGEIERVIVERSIRRREQSYQRALLVHEVGHAAGLKHAPPGAGSIMIPGLRRQDEDHYRQDFGPDDVLALRSVYGS
jgi:diadenosine tetraphosphatase ApaH/serine/threonine PP2A family protein phosphatase